MAALPYMQLYIADYLADTMHLSTEEHGAYLLLMFNYWQTGKPIPKNRLAKIARMGNDRWISVESSLKEFFTDNGVEWIHERIERDLDSVRMSLEQKSAAGKASAEARRAKKGTGKQRENNARSSGVDNPLEQKPNGNPTNKDPDNKEDLKDKNHLSMGGGENLANESQEENHSPPSYLEGIEIPIGKFTMFDGWAPSADFQKRAAFWNRILDGPEPGYTVADLARFVVFWSAEGRAFNHAQWEQKFADSVVHEHRQESMKKPTGGNHAEKSNTGESQTVREIRAARAAWERERQGVDPVGNHGGNIFEQVDD